MRGVAQGFDIWRSDNYWTCECGDPVKRGEEYAVRIRDNEEMCMDCYEDETRYGRRER